MVFISHLSFLYTWPISTSELIIIKTINITLKKNLTDFPNKLNSNHRPFQNVKSLILNLMPCKKNSCPTTTDSKIKSCSRVMHFVYLSPSHSIKGRGTIFEVVFFGFFFVFTDINMQFLYKIDKDSIDKNRVEPMDLVVDEELSKQ